MSYDILSKEDGTHQSFQFFHKAILDHLTYSIAKDRFSATQRDKFVSFSLSVRDLLIER